MSDDRISRKTNNRRCSVDFYVYTDVVHTFVCVYQRCHIFESLSVCLCDCVGFCIIFLKSHGRHLFYFCSVILETRDSKAKGRLSFA